jgi:hypothetical protein
LVKASKIQRPDPKGSRIATPMEKIETEGAFDPNRRLCPDGSCVGLLGSDGLCSVCQRPEGAAAAADPDDEPPPQFGGTSADFDPGRRLCDDGSCVGVIGADGHCGTCGRKAD